MSASGGSEDADEYSYEGYSYSGCGTDGGGEGLGDETEAGAWDEVVWEEVGEGECSGATRATATTAATAAGAGGGEGSKKRRRSSARLTSENRKRLQGLHLAMVYAAGCAAAGMARVAATADEMQVAEVVSRLPGGLLAYLDAAADGGRQSVVEDAGAVAKAALGAGEDAMAAVLTAMRAWPELAVRVVTAVSPPPITAVSAALVDPSIEPERPSKRNDRKNKAGAGVDDEVAAESTQKSIHFGLEVLATSELRWVEVLEPLRPRLRPGSRWYVMAYEVATGRASDVTALYVGDWGAALKARLKPDPLRRMVAYFGEASLRSAAAAVVAARQAEARALEAARDAAQVPTTKSGLSSSRLYVLESLIGKTMAVVPGAAAVASFRGEAVYRRRHVQKLRARTTWLRGYGRVVVDDAAAIKTSSRGVPLYGRWQTERYTPGRVQVPGMVPVNEHGNVEVFQSWMVPIGCVHVRGREAKRAAIALGMNYAEALVGFARRGGYPVFDGVVVCLEYADTLEAAVLEMRVGELRAARAKIAKQVVARWRRLVEKLLIYDRVRRESTTGSGDGGGGGGGGVSGREENPIVLD
ncbi:uncharacterized protein AMSG_11440 [Thecamonas trahens ATCC 50062]|uniref:Uncharacterized protein n=1 Tax=Thecamonas trahens ATCC 50062 TaxID=461836 RepID=A0A0L0DV67_THETB|nr:hypothetical protein AMSG_11440 [Thecamonas trahens ATCC 50062]KNC56194.1 hypothetical protein AMSG_11440 [Thecamonas trahens ATCC 50062]|eukprot:XP_013752684.1 hypothetical protein AMSG_11440 [Thecamonas trahens ATCC 50062]